ncbi:type VI secretion system baseplate subunit TssK [Paracoccus sp. MC1862]|uniref:type VI secretion system baseplate subunit TssK n=1 Tax=Paracoccus sp. MC1862 TaxID=2760307 RepID=UPI001603757A|nr:type VI secretion system baseplate subunit TssK [Paracoccus sp. MC1862]MBB1499073.1 type VI secretion system baseplate subunit TssK [Paracoccus sp. MC1862]QQO46074.1 type VI secretion system baseplate subunit TssK [Paracoccus sp. MC1862]
MAEGSRVVWSEGLFLRPQHFQQQDRHIEGGLRMVLRAQPRQAWGFVTLRLDAAALDAGQVGLTEAEGILPDGTAFRIPADCPAPAPATVARATPAGAVLLGVAPRQPGVPAVDPAHAEAGGARWRGEWTTLPDEIRGGAEPAEVEIARLNMRLILPGEPTQGAITLPLAGIEGLAADGHVALSEGWLPPALTVSAAPWYAGLLKELVTGLDRIIEAQGAMVLGGAGRSVENLLILELANAARPRLQHLLAQDLAHPSDLFAELAGLAGQMATYGSSTRGLSPLPDYDHANPQPAFAALTDALRSLILSLRHVEPKSRALPVARHAQNVWKVRIDNPDMLRTCRIVLRVGSEMSDEGLMQLFTRQVTVGAADEFETLWTSRLPGIPLKPLHSQPREIPYDGDRLCLELDRKSEHWARLQTSPGFVLGVSGKLEREPEIDCYAISR